MVLSFSSPFFACAQDRFAIESMIRLDQQHQKEVEDAEMQRIAIKDNWCARPNIQKNLVNFINEKLVPEPFFTKLKKKAKFIEDPITKMAFTNNDKLRTVQISCSAIVQFVDGTKAERMTFNFPMNY
jgi:hypothetical protein